MGVKRAFARQRAFPPEIRALAEGIGELALSVLLVLLIVSYWFGHRIGSPYDEVAALAGRKLLRGARGTGRQAKEPKPPRQAKGQLPHVRRGPSFVRIAVGDAPSQRTAACGNGTNAGRMDRRRDLKTPLSSIRGYAHMLEADVYDWSPLRSFARIMLDKAQHMDGLINDLTLTYQLRSGGQAPVLETVDLNEFMAEAVREASRHPQFEQSRIRFFPPERPVTLAIYKPWLQRIVDNLVANALLHNGEGTTLAVSVRKEGRGDVTITFEDDGEGMDEATKARLFDRYYRGTDSESRMEGTGLGMAISKALTEALGGTIEVESDPGRGTAIRVVFQSALSRGE